MMFKSPEMLLLFAILPILGRLLVRARRLNERSAARLRGERAASKVATRSIVLLLGAFSALIVALAQPIWNPHRAPLATQGRDVVVALDISRSMLAADVYPSRLAIAKISLYESLEQLRNHRIGLITFAGAASVRVPLTLDHNFVRYMIERAAPSDADVGSTSLQSAIEKAIDVVLSEGKQGEQDVIIFTDGEDHVSDVEKTSEALRKSGARVLIIGIGDPVNGSKIPSVDNPEAWMQYQGEAVVTRLDEKTLRRLAAESPNVIYYAARTRPFDFIARYRQMISDTADLPAGAEDRVVYTEGYPFFIALALMLWLVPLSRRWLPGMVLWVVLSGCGAQDPLPDASFREAMQEGCVRWRDVQQTITDAPEAALVDLDHARAFFLQAAMLRPGNAEAARQIAGVTAQIHAIESRIEAKRKSEQDLRQKLQEAIKQLRELARREDALSRQSRRLLRKRPRISPKKKAAIAPSVREEQSLVNRETGSVFATVTDVQASLKAMRLEAFSDERGGLAAELDAPRNELAAARRSQQTALNHLQPDAVSWPKVNTAFQRAASHLKAALRLLPDQSRQQKAKENSAATKESAMDREFDEDAEWSESDQSANMSLPLDSGQFKTALENRALPIPNYRAEDIMAEEAANMEQRAQRQSKAAGAKVEKNW